MHTTCQVKLLVLSIVISS